MKIEAAETGVVDVALENTVQRLYCELAPVLLSKRNDAQRESFPNTLRGIQFEVSGRMERALGMCYPTKRMIRLNRTYFLSRQALLPYTLFHELVHQYLYDLGEPWGHTAQFYALMEVFPAHRFPRDPNVHIHERQAKVGQKIHQAQFEEFDAREKMEKILERLFPKKDGLPRDDGFPKRDGSQGAS
jgi:predicted metal-dependent hydrolase